jgi:hypothetical protein
MPRRKTFRKRRQKRVQKGGAPRTIDGINNNTSLPEFKNDEETKYYGMVRKTRKNTGGNSSSNVSSADEDVNYESFVVNQAQKDVICGNAEDKEKVMIEDPSAQGDSFKQFYENEDKEELITFFEFANGAGENKKLQDLKIENVENINWAKFVGCQ